MGRGRNSQEQANQMEAAAGVEGLRACGPQPGSSAGVCKEAEKALGRELECIPKGWEAIERFQQGGSMTDLQFLKIILDCGGSFMNMHTHIHTYTHTQGWR